MNLGVFIAALVLPLGSPAGAEVCQKSGEKAAAMGTVCALHVRRDRGEHRAGAAVPVDDGGQRRRLCEPAAANGRVVLPDRRAHYRHDQAMNL